MHGFTATLPFDIYELHLFEAVARLGSFTKAAARIGLTQSALTRQIQGMEQKLGVPLFERSTRRVSLTAAGDLLLARCRPILREVAQLALDLESGRATQPRALRIGLCRTIGLSYLPGFFVHFQRKNPSVRLQVVQERSPAIVALLQNTDLDLAIVTSPSPPAKGLDVLHQFADEFTGLVPASAEKPHPGGRITLKQFAALAQRFPWLSIGRDTTTGDALQRWLRSEGAKLEPSVEADNFDLIINLVSLGLGCSIVPHRALPLYLQRRLVRKVALRPVFSRSIQVLARKSSRANSTIQEFVREILF